MTIYNITSDMRALQSLINGLTDKETGETREVTEEERQTFLEWVNEIESNFKEKFDNICRFFKNIQAQADVAAAERDTLKAEMDRLSKRAKARENEAAQLKGLLWFAFDNLGMKNYKTDLFSVGIQNTRKTAKPDCLFNADNIPVKYLKRELASSAVYEAVKDGTLYEKEGDINRGSLFYRSENGEQRLNGVSYSGGQALVIR
jgi:hypothetical protein